MVMNQDEAEEKRRALIEKRAFEIYESRGGSHGFDREDWEQAERDIDGSPSDDALPPDDEDEVEENKGIA
jgi:hypothetical protein